MAASEAVDNVTITPTVADGAAAAAAAATTLASSIDIRTARLPESKTSRSTDDFDPYDYRDPQTMTINTSMAYFNLLRTVFGAGMLAMPLALGQVGLIMGSVLLVCVGLLVLHMHLTLLRCLYEISQRLRVPHISYRYGFRIALLHGPTIFQCIGERGPTIIAISMVLSQFGICTAFIIFTSDSLRDILDWDNSRPAMFVLLIPYILLEFLMKSLKIISYVSLLGNLMNLVGLLMVFYLIFYQLCTKPLGSVLFAKWETGPFLYAYGSMLFNLSAVGVILSLDKAMSNPRIMTARCGVVTIGMLVPIAISTIFGVLGFLAFGIMEENILRSLPYDDIISMIAIGLYLVAVALAFPIQCYPATQIIMEVIRNYNPHNPPSDNTMLLVQNFIEPCFVILAFGVGYLIPFQAPFIAFVGNLCTSLLALIFPALMELCIMYPDEFGKYKIYLFKNLCIILISVLFWIVGIVISIDLIYVRLLSLYSLQST